MRRTLLALSLALCTAAPALQAQSGGTVRLTSFLQDAFFTNTGTTTLTRLSYTLGPAATGRATWDSQTGGGTASDFLSNNRWFQTVTWNGLNVGAGSSAAFGNLDIDFIQQLSPLNINEQIITGGLDAAYLEAQFSNGEILRANLLNQDWAPTQNLTFAPVSTVPEPSTYALMAAGLAAIVAIRRRRSRA